MIKVGIVGCSGYTAIEAIRLLLRHPQVQIVAATSRQADGSTICDMHPPLTGRRRGFLLLAPRGLGTDRVAYP